MKRILTSNIKQALLNKVFFISIFCFMLTIFISSIETIIAALRTEELLTNSFHATLVLDSLSIDAITLIFPIVCALPYTTAFIDDIKSGYIKEYLPRTTVKEYISGKILSCYLSGGLVIFIGLLLAYGISFLMFSPMEAALPVGEVAPAYFSEFFNKCIPFFFAGGFLSLFGMLVATATNSKYMAYSSPFIIYYILIILKERYFADMYVLYPKEWLNPSDKWLLGNWGVVILLVECAIVTALCFACTAKRRIERI